MKRGLVLEGGAMRGLFTAGVLDVLMEEGIPFDGVIGVSAGACFGCNFKSRQIGRTLRYNKRFCKDKRYCSLWSLLTTGDLYGVDFCYRKLPEELDIFDNDAFNENPLDFYVVASDVETGRPVYQKCNKSGEDLLLWLRASASMPLVSRIVEIGNRKLLDGGICDSIPLGEMERMGYEKNLVVVTQPEDYRKKPNRLMPLIRRVFRDYPNMIQAMETRHLMYNRQTEEIAEKEKKGEILVIRPAEQLPVGRTEKNPKKLQEAYELGRTAAKEKLVQIREYFAGEVV